MRAVADLRVNRNIDDNYVFNLEKQEREIDYAKVNKVIADKRAESLEFLRKAIQA